MGLPYDTFISAVFGTPTAGAPDPPETAVMTLPAGTPAVFIWSLIAFAIWSAYHCVVRSVLFIASNIVLNAEARLKTKKGF
jgi:hypothetical protein